MSADDYMDQCVQLSEELCKMLESVGPQKVSVRAIKAAVVCAMANHAGAEATEHYLRRHMEVRLDS